MIKQLAIFVSLKTSKLVIGSIEVILVMLITCNDYSHVFLQYALIFVCMYFICLMQHLHSSIGLHFITEPWLPQRCGTLDFICLTMTIWKSISNLFSSKSPSTQSKSVKTSLVTKLLQPVVWYPQKTNYNSMTPSLCRSICCNLNPQWSFCKISEILAAFSFFEETQQKWQTNN